MRMVHIYKSDKYGSVIHRISQKSINDRKIKKYQVSFLLSICVHLFLPF